MPFPFRSCAVHALGLLLAVCLLMVCLPMHATTRPAPHPSDALSDSLVIPGPLRSFLRMAGVSQQVTPDQVLPAVARNVSLLGFQNHQQTEFLILLNRYLHQARELAALAGPDGEIRVAGCDSAARLIAVLGYRMRGSCGERSVALVTADSERAFLTIDSGFPLTQFERALSKNAPFNFPYSGTRVPIFFPQRDWAALVPKDKNRGDDLLTLLLADREIDDLYWALSRCDEETRLALLHSPGLRKLQPLGTVFSLYGSGIHVSAGKVVVPGGASSEWEDLVGDQTSSPGNFIYLLLTKDRGWLAAYYDVMTRLSQSQQQQLTANGRLKSLYEAYRSTAPRTNSSDGVFPRNADLLILYTSLKWEPNGAPSIHEDLDTWSSILGSGSKLPKHPHSSHPPDLRFDTAEDFLQTLVSETNLAVPGSESGNAIETFSMIEAINSGKPSGQRLAGDTERLIAERLPQFGRWFQIFAEFPQLDDASITHFVSAADHIGHISNGTLRANGLGALQANIGLWQIFARQGQIPASQLSSTWQCAVDPFTNASTSAQLFEAARASLRSLLTAVAGNAGLATAALTQDQVIDLLAGPAQQSDEGRRVHEELVRRINAVLDDQHLVSLDTLFGLYDGLGDMAHGAALGDQLLPLAGDLREFQMPRPVFTGGERAAWSPVIYSSRHTELQVRTDLARIIKSGTPGQLEAARGQLTPFLRDTLVGLNYAFYEPPGAEVLHNNPLFVRSHDFSSVSLLGLQHIWGDAGLIGVGATAGGGAYLIGSLVDLPYALAATEQDFMAPANVQALIWKEAVPNLMVDAVVPRWWTVSRTELHAVALYQRAGDELIAASARSPELRGKVIVILSDRMAPDRLTQTQQALDNPDTPSDAIALATPSEEFYLASEFRKRFPAEAAAIGPASSELDELLRTDPAETSTKRLAQDFGSLHPALLSSTSRTLANTKPIPAYGGPASRLLAESWESNNLYWARLADEMGYSPVMLNLLVPALTRRMVVNIFASNIDDWPALLRAMHQTGNEFRAGKIPLPGEKLVARQ